MTKLIVKEFQRVFRNKKDLHEQVVRPGFYLRK